MKPAFPDIAQLAAGTLRPLSALTAAEPLPTAFAALDAALAGGLPRGRVVELLGAPSAGALTVSYTTLSRAQAAGAWALYLTLDALPDIEYAAGCGVDLGRLVVARADSVTQALAITHDVVAQVGGGIIVIDLATTPSLPPDLVRRVTRPLAQSGGTLLLVASATRGLAGESALRLGFRRLYWHYAGRDVVGWRAAITVLKDKRQPSGAVVELDIALP